MNVSSSSHHEPSDGNLTFNSEHTSSARMDGSGLFEAVDIPILLLGGDCRLARFNRAAGELLGMQPSDIGRLPTEIRVLRDVADLQQCCEIAIAEGISDRRDLRRADQWFLVRVAQYLGTSGDIQGAVLTFANVTTLRTSVAQAIYEREFTKAIFNALGQAVVILDTNLRVQTANRSFYELFGVSRDQAYAVPLCELGDQHWKTLPLWQTLKLAAGPRDLTVVEVEREFPTFGRRTVQLEGRPFIRDGSALIIFGIHDVTQRKQAEEALRDSEVRYRKLISLLPVGVYTCKAPSGVIDFFNNAAKNLWGREPGPGEQFCGSLKLVRPDGVTLPHQECPMALALSQGRGLLNQEVDIERPDGTRITALVNIDVLRDGADRVVGAINVFQDISAIKKAEVQLREADRRKDEFLATLAHELRNPLAPISNALEILRRSPVGNGGTERVREMMQRQVMHLNRLVDDLLEISRISRGKIELKKEFINLADVIRHATETSKSLIDAGGHTFKVQLPNEPIFIHGDLIRLSQVFTNLINNAAKFTPVPGTITLTAEANVTSVVVSLSDTGVGLSAEMLKHVFEMFVQVRTKSQQDGLGIGLSLAQSLVSMHGGSIEAQSRGLGHGSTFIVRLPVAHTPIEKVDDQSAPGQEQSLSGRKILIVDDNRDAAQSLQMMLELSGAVVQIAFDGVSALQMIQEWRPSYIFLDIGMPGMNGHEVARSIRQYPEYRDMVLIALSGWGQTADKERSRLAGFDHHLVKPADIDELHAILGGNR